MKFRVYFLLAVSILAVALSCKKGDDEDTKQYLSGKLKISMHAYVNPGYTKSFLVDTMSTLSRDDGGSIGYYFRASSFAVLDTVKKVSDATSREFTFTAPDSLGSFTLMVAGFSTDYYSSSAEASFTIVKPGHGEKTSLTGFDINDSDRQFTDNRDKRQYYITEVGNTEWMRENLAWSGAGHAFQNCDVMSSIFGRYYTWEEAQKACPEEWRLPSEKDWQDLLSNMGIKADEYSDAIGAAGKLMENISFNGTVMWPFSRNVKISNSARFSAIPSGYMTLNGNGGKFSSLNNYAVFWSSDKAEDGAHCRYIYKDEDCLYSGVRDTKSFCASVRCVRDKKNN